MCSCPQFTVIRAYAVVSHTVLVFDWVKYMDRDLYVPVRCDEAETEYSGKWYWEPIKTIIQVNGEVIDRNAVRTRSSFRPGDSVVVKYKSRTFSGVVVNPDQEREETVDPHVHVKSSTKTRCGDSTVSAPGQVQERHDSRVTTKRCGNSTVPAPAPARKRRKVFKKQGIYGCVCSYKM